MSSPLMKALEETTETQIKFICDELKISYGGLQNATEEQLEDIYDIMCDIETAETPAGDEPLSDRCKIASDIVTLWGNHIAEDAGYFYEDSFEKVLL